MFFPFLRCGLPPGGYSTRVCRGRYCAMLLLLLALRLVLVLVLVLVLLLLLLLLVLLMLLREPSSTSDGANSTASVHMYRYALLLQQCSRSSHSGCPQLSHVRFHAAATESEHKHSHTVTLPYYHHHHHHQGNVALVFLVSVGFSVLVSGLLGGACSSKYIQHIQYKRTSR